MANIFHVHRANDTITLGQGDTVITCNPLTATRLIASGAGKEIISSNLVNWISGTENEITVIDDSDGTVTVGLSDIINLGNSV